MFLQKILRFLSVGIIKKHQPVIIAITGSVGKTTTKEMIYSVLRGLDIFVGKSEKNYNTEIGVSLGIIGLGGENRYWWQWLRVFGRAFRLLFGGKYPDVLVLEMAADKPGDIKYFCDFIPIDIGVLTNVGVSHLEKFKTKEAVFQEKSYLLKQAKKLVVFGGDNLSRDVIEKKVKCKIYSGGFKPDNDLFVVDFEYSLDNGRSVTKFKIKYPKKQSELEGFLSVWGRPYLQAMTISLLVGRYFDDDPQKMLAVLSQIKPIKQHLNLLPGIKRSWVIDDTYNSAPDSVREALAVIGELKGGRKIVVLGDMLELGSVENDKHREIGAMVGQCRDVIFVAVGQRMKVAIGSFKKVFSDEFKGVDLRERVHWFADANQAGKFVQDLIEEGDFILVKGSRGMKMEKVVKEIVAFGV